jgi:hypothetical protein
LQEENLENEMSSVQAKKQTTKVLYEMPCLRLHI